METSLQEYIREERQRGGLKDLEALTESCRSRNRVIPVTVVGAGDAFIMRYWDTLKMFVTCEDVILTVADMKELDVLADERVKMLEASEHSDFRDRARKMRKQYDDFQRTIAQPGSHVQYLNRSDPGDNHRYDDLQTADFVFILVPDHAHLDEAQQWLKKSRMIIVEKPFAPSARRSVEFNQEYYKLGQYIGGDKTFVVPFDHYLAKMMKCISALNDELLSQIGDIESIEVLFTEHNPPEPHREDTLSGGLIADLYPHILAMLSPFADPHPKYEKVFVSSVAKLETHPYHSETFAYITYSMRDRWGHAVGVTAVMGKGIGDRDEKYVHVRGSKGQMVINFVGGHPRFGDRQAARIFGRDTELNPEVVKSGAFGNIYESGHAESIDAILKGQYLNMPFGGQRIEEAHRNTLEIDKHRDGVAKLRGNIATYQLHEPWEAIVTRATPLFGRPVALFATQ